MAFTFPPVKRPLRAIVAASLLASVALAGTPAWAASNRPFQSYHSPNDSAGNENNFNLDQDPCMGRTGRNRGQSAAVSGCPDGGEGYSMHGNGGPRHPGSSAFGLQFNSEDD